jgi:hypothetical protein
MSRYGYLRCERCNHVLWLGKAVFSGETVRHAAV